MVGIIQKVKVGSKGQIVIPKILRENLGIAPGKEILLSYENNILAIQNSGEPIEEFAARMAKGTKNKLSPKEMRDMAAEQRWKHT